jgi:2-oxoglutarate dehydrogenase E1 component
MESGILMLVTLNDNKKTQLGVFLKMSDNSRNTEKPWEGFHGPNLGYAVELYEQYKNDSHSVDTELKEMFDKWGPPPASEEFVNGAVADRSRGTADDTVSLKKVVAAVKLADSIRTNGHLAAKINPLDEHSRDAGLLDPSEFGLNEDDLKAIPAKVVWEDAPDHVQNGFDAIKQLRKIYTKSLAYEFSHVHEVDEVNWLNNMVESDSIERTLSKEEKIALLRRLAEVEGFEKFLHKTFVGQKRFSIEGVDTLVPMLDDIIRSSVHDGAENVMIGMAHRGRLNVLAHILGKPYSNIFSEFHHSPNKELVPSEGSMGINYGWTGDVKYHLGADRAIEEDNMVRARLTLANNPSHLEFVNPVVEGYARAAQEDRKQPGVPTQDVSKSFPILIHGDAAFPGEGIVAETLNLSQLRGYKTGGTVHIIANNLLGFTTESDDSRSTKYASDLAKGFEIPIVHVNADDPEACLEAINFAYEYRRRFQKDFLIDLIGYRKYGHNEADDPAATQPDLYGKINQHPTVRARYAETLQSDDVITEKKSAEIEQSVWDKLQTEYDKISADETSIDMEDTEAPETVLNGLPHIDTSVPIESLREINSNLLKWPEGFTVYPKLERILKRRSTSLDDDGKIDWASGETLAFASILQDGTPIRLTGQDSERGTFAHRHLVLHDSKTGETFSPLHTIPEAHASFSVYNSPLSEASVVGFEYGYDVFSSETLVLWEAQFGDFANAAQVIFDQFMSAGRAKWGQKSSLVLLLPHGYEGQGPEHSSGRLERFLQLAAESNWTVANLTNAAQYFHILRRQAAIIEREEVRPLIVMTPKSLLRNPHSASPGKELSEGKFQTILEQPGLGEKTDKIERVVLCSGKIAVDLASELDSDENNTAPDWLHVLRIEQLYPFPKHEVKEILNRYKHLKEIVWVQEEPRNMGAWTYIDSRITDVAPNDVDVHYIGRPERSSTATGQPDVHKQEQDQIVKQALNRKSNRGGNSRD